MNDASDVGDHYIWNFAAQVETKHIQVLQIIIAYHLLSAFYRQLLEFSFLERIQWNKIELKLR